MAVLPALELIRTDDLDAVVAAVDDDNVPFAGGTELVPAMRLGLRRPLAIVDLKRTPELRSISVDDEAERVHIGAAVTHHEISTNADVLSHAPTLAGAAARVGNARVRATGTIGGNLCFAEPRSDLACVLVALAAEARARSRSGERTVTIADLVVGAFETSLASDEVLTSVSIPFEPPAMSYWKLQSYERPTLGVTTIHREGTWEITVGAATERPVRIVVAEGDTVALDAFVERLELSDDLAGPPDYKRDVLRRHLLTIVGGGGS